MSKVQYLKKHHKEKAYAACIAAYIVLLAYTNLRINLSESISISLTSPLSILMISLGAFFMWHKNVSIKNVYKSERGNLLIGGLFVTTFFLATVGAMSVHAWGIYGEWILLPFLASVAVVTLARKTDPTGTILNRSLCALLVAVSLSATVHALYGVWTYDGRLAGLWPSPNHLALFIAPLLSFSIVQAVVGKDHWLYVLVSVLAIPPLLLTQSLGGIVSVALVCFVLVALVIAKKHPKKLLVIAVVALAIVAFSVGVKWQNAYTVPERNPLESRIMIWQTSVDLLRESPLMGIDVGSFQERYLSAQKYYDPYLEWAVPLPHSLYLAIWLYGGILSLVAFILLIAHAAKQFLAQKKEARLTTLPFFAMLLTILIHGTVDTTLLRPELAILFWLSVLSFRVTRQS